MLRVYLSKNVRLHIWHSAFAVPNVSRLHTHPWNFCSLVVAGSLVNKRYREPPNTGLTAEHAMSQIIQCGPGGCLKGEPRRTLLLSQAPELYAAGSTYYQHRDEVHDTIPKDGTVTLVTRTFDGDEDHARVFWPVGTKWVSAEPRTATKAEVDAIVSAALSIY